MVICPKCGYENREGLKVCLNCGYNLPETSEAPEPHKEVKKEVSTEKPKKSGHGLRNLIIVIILIFLVLLFIGGFASLSSKGNSTDQGGLSDSLYYLDFDGIFTVDFNEEMPYYEYSGGSTCEKYWTFYEYDSAVDSKLKIYYWLGDKEYDLSMLEEFTEPKIDGNLRVYTNNNINEDNPQNDDYLVVVDNGEKVVGFMGADVDDLKDYANSVKFSNNS